MPIWPWLLQIVKSNFPDDHHPLPHLPRHRDVLLLQNHRFEVIEIWFVHQESGGSFLLVLLSFSLLPFSSSDIISNWVCFGVYGCVFPIIGYSYRGKRFLYCLRHYFPQWFLIARADLSFAMIINFVDVIYSERNAIFVVLLIIALSNCLWSMILLFLCQCWNDWNDSGSGDHINELAFETLICCCRIRAASKISDNPQSTASDNNQSIGCAITRRKS